LPTWTIGIEISGARIDAEGLLRVENVFKREFPDFGADCAIWSGRLAIQVTVRAPTPPDALESALRTIEFAFEETGLDINRTAVIDTVTVRDVLRESWSPGAESLPRALLRRLSPSRRE
jgi:hypothetical protein